jgi:hypothetical protein
MALICCIFLDNYIFLLIPGLCNNLIKGTNPERVLPSSRDKGKEAFPIPKGGLRGSTKQRGC